jgi:hypothetical protein
MSKNSFNLETVHSMRELVMRMIKSRCGSNDFYLILDVFDRYISNGSIGDKTFDDIWREVNDRVSDCDYLAV